MAAKKQSKRIYQKNVVLEHDLYKLQVAKAAINVSWTDDPDYMRVEHCHFFHTIDSQGTPQNTSTAIAGHFHVMEIDTPATDDAPATYKCSPPMIWVHDKKGNRKLQQVNRDDDHTHEVDYVKSEKLSPPKINPEYVKMQAQQPRPPESVPGILG